LYPDISKLHEDPPRDVYGQEQPIPEFNLFVAGTSCKNFSMLRSNKRLDIEDRGCSGETFIAATELLFKEKPKMAIFENVEGAPWEKMSEYITGRVKLSECDKSKAIKNIKDKNKGLSFVKEENGDIVVDYVPAVYGIRCGAIIDGFLEGTSTKLQQVAWPSGSKKSCTLNELMTKNKISKAQDTLVFKTDVIYCTQICKTDTKDYGLPQTRNRVYMFVWQPEKGNVADDLGIYWKAVVEYLKSPVRHSLPSFVLNVDHEIIRTFREALNGPPGRKTKLANFLEPDFW
jgi:site-specific DNA-cytosine methylase